MGTHKGTQAMVGAGLDPLTHTLKTAAKACALCRNTNVYVDLDTARYRVLGCDDCGGMEIISKGAGGWWYHGTKLPAQWSANFLATLKSA